MSNIARMRSILERLYPWLEGVKHIHLSNGDILYASEVWDVLEQTKDGWISGPQSLPLQAHNCVSNTEGRCIFCKAPMLLYTAGKQDQ